MKILVDKLPKRSSDCSFSYRSHPDSDIRGCKLDDDTFCDLDCESSCVYLEERKLEK